MTLTLILFLIAFCVFGTMLLWVFYLAWTNLDRAEQAGKLTPQARILAIPVIYLGLWLDGLINITVMTIVFVEPPREWLVTHRLERHLRGEDSWRRDLSKLMCDHLLDPFDPRGRHCNLDEE